MIRVIIDHRKNQSRFKSCGLIASDSSRLVGLSTTASDQSIFTRYARKQLYQVDHAHGIAQEEDFVTHTYNRSLLDQVDHVLILELLEDTIELLSGSDEIPLEVKDALCSRLQFRAKFLGVVEVAASRTAEGIKAKWTELLSSLPQVTSSAKLGKPVPESFSVKVQRKLASTVPPRPIVNVSQDHAFEHLERLCRDAAAAVDVFEYRDSHSLFVCTKTSHNYWDTDFLCRHLYLCFKHVDLSPRCMFVLYCSTISSAI